MSECKGCGKKIIWGQTAEGKKIPLDAVAPVYNVIVGNSGDERLEHIVRAESAYVSHFATCPDDNRFSKGGKSAGGGEKDKEGVQGVQPQERGEAAVEKAEDEGSGEKTGGSG